MSCMDHRSDEQRWYLLQMCVLDSLIDAETVPLIRELLNHPEFGALDAWHRDFEDAEIVDALEALVERGSVRVLQKPPGTIDLVPATLARNEPDGQSQLWFARTDAGRAELDAWTPPDG